MNHRNGAFAEDFKDKEGVWVSAYHNASVVAYNTKLLKPVDLPKNYDDRSPRSGRAKC